MMTPELTARYGVGQLAKEYTGAELPLQVCCSAAGFYIGTMSPDGTPCSRESAEYWKERKRAEFALWSGYWTQRANP